MLTNYKVRKLKEKTFFLHFLTSTIAISGQPFCCHWCHWFKLQITNPWFKSQSNILLAHRNNICIHHYFFHFPFCKTIPDCTKIRHNTFRNPTKIFKPTFPQFLLSQRGIFYSRRIYFNKLPKFKQGHLGNNLMIYQ